MGVNSNYICFIYFFISADMVKIRLFSNVMNTKTFSMKVDIVFNNT